MKYSEIIRRIIMEGCPNSVRTNAICAEFNKRCREESWEPKADCCAGCPMFEFYTGAMDCTDKECQDFCESDDYVNLRWELVYDLESIGD